MESQNFQLSLNPPLRQALVSRRP